jgi:hypothetical protein
MFSHTSGGTITPGRIPLFYFIVESRVSVSGTRGLVSHMTKEDGSIINLQDSVEPLRYLSVKQVSSPPYVAVRGLCGRSDRVAFVIRLCVVRDRLS